MVLKQKCLESPGLDQQHISKLRRVP